VTDSTTRALERTGDTLALALRQRRGEGNMKTAYLVGLLEPDGIGVRLTSIDVFSEPDPGNMGRERKTVVIAEAWAEDFEAAVQHVLKILDVHPWLKPLLSERASRWLL